MKLRQVRFAVEIARTGSFARAADACHATQPTLSSGLAALEGELGDRLFRRTTRSVELTPFGRHMLPSLQGLLDGEAEVHAAARDWRVPPHPVLRLGFSPLVDMRLLHQVLEPYRRLSPDTEIFFKECLTDDMSVRLANGTVDFVVAVSGSLDGVWHSQPFYEDPLRYLPQDGVNDVPSGPVAIADLPDTPIIMTGGGCGLNGALERLFVEEGGTLKPYPGQAISYQVIADWAGLGIGAGLLPDAHIAKTEASVPVRRGDGTDACFRFDWHWSQNGAGGNHIAQFRDHIHRIVPALVSGMAA